MDLAEFRAIYERPAWTPPALEAGARVRGFIGLDAGSTSTKAVLLDEDGRVLAKAYQLSRGNPIEDAIEMFASLGQQVESQGASVGVSGLVTTGYAKDILKDVFAGDAALVETVAHANSAQHIYEDPHVIVDVGGQDIKIIVMHDGRVKDFRLNTACSAGNGYFLQAIARSFGYDVEQFAETAFTAREMPVFGQGCVVFLQSEIANVQRHGWKPQEILAGLAAVLPRNVFLYVAKAPNLSRFGWRFVLQGGTQRNLAAVKAQVDFIRDNFKGQARQPDIVLHEHCGEAGAIGAGLEAIRLWRTGHQTTFIGLDAAKRVSFDTTCDDDTRCHFCKNECIRTFIDVSVGAPAGAADRVAADVDRLTNRRFIVAGCEKGAAEDVARMKDIKAAEDAVKKRTPNLVALASREVWKLRHPASVADELPPKGWTAASRARRARFEKRGRLRVGIPRVFNMYALAPFYTGYLESLGVAPKNIVFSDFTNNEMYRTGATRGAIDPCFPSKVALAHVHNLLFVKHKRAALDAIFFPMVDVLPSRFFGTRASNACPTVALTPQTVRAAFSKDSDLFAEAGVTYLDGLIDMEDKPLLRRQMFEMWDPLLGLSWEENERAIQAGHDTLADYEKTVRIGGARRARGARAREPAGHPAARAAVPPRPGPEPRDSGGTAEARLRRVLAEHAAARRRPPGSAVRRGDPRGADQARDGHLRRLEALAGGQQQPEDLGGEVRGAVSEPGGGGAVELQVRPRRADLRDDRGDHREVGHAVLRVQGHRREQAGRRDQAAARDDRLLAETGAGIAAGARPPGGTGREVAGVLRAPPAARPGSALARGPREHASSR